MHWVCVKTESCEVGAIFPGISVIFSRKLVFGLRSWEGEDSEMGLPGDSTNYGSFFFIREGMYYMGFC